MNQPDNKHFEAYLLISFAALAALPILYILRFLDDNRLTSWQWVMDNGVIGSIYLFAVPAILFAFGFARFTLPERWPAFILFCTAFLIPALLWDIPEVLLDASRYFVQAKYLLLYGPDFFWHEWGKTIGAWTDLPLIPFLYGLLFKLFGESRLPVQILNSLFFALTAVLTYRIGALLWDDKTGFFAGLLLLAIPYLPTQVPLLLVDSATMFFMTLAIYTYLNALVMGGFFRCCVSSLAIFLAFSAKYSTWPMLGILPLITLVHMDKDRSRIMRRSSFIGLVSLLAISVAFMGKSEVFLPQIHLLRTFQAEGLKRWQESYISSFFFQICPLVSLAALWGAFRAIRLKESRFLIAGWFGIFMFVLEVKRIRYLLPLLPLLTLMAAYGLQGLRDERLKRFTCYVGVSLSLVVLFVAYKPFLKRTSMNNLLEAGHYLNRLPEKAFSVSCLPQHDSSGSTYAAMPLLDLYTEKILQSETTWPSMTGQPLDFQKTSLRFSWELPQPDYYRVAVPNGTMPRVIISDRLPLNPEEPHGVHRNQTVMKQFSQHTGVFRYKTLVSILTP